jgi:hypothetical protein
MNQQWIHSMLSDIINEIRNYPGLTRKRNIYRATSLLAPVADFGATIADFGEDAAVIQYKDEFLLLAAEGIWSGLIEANPYGAGKASVMASVNDIYAMGGRPLAMVNVVGISESKYYEEIMRGIQKGCEKFKVPMVGGHLHPDTREVSLSVAILGIARKLLLSNNAREGQDIVFAVDLDGRGYQCKPVISWIPIRGKIHSRCFHGLRYCRCLLKRNYVQLQRMLAMAACWELLRFCWRHHKKAHT